MTARIKARGMVCAAAAWLAALTGAAHSGGCLDEVKSVYRESLYAYDRPAYRSEKSVYDPEGKLIHVFVSTVESPLRTISGVRGDAMALVIDRQVWTGPGPDGPWTEAPSNFPADRKAVHDRAHEQQLANISDVDCMGEVDVEGQTYLGYGFTTQTDPDPNQGGLFFGERSTVYLDPESREVMRWEQTDFITPWMAEPDRAHHVTVFQYDDTIHVTPPGS